MENNTAAKIEEAVETANKIAFNRVRIGIYEQYLAELEALIAAARSN